MGFIDNVKSTYDISSCYKNGLQGIKNSDRIKINCKNTQMINGSVNIDECLKNKYPQDNRWDYAIGYNEICYFIEVHPASTNEIKTVINKLNWLKNWLEIQSSPLLYNHGGFHWIASGKFSINKNSPQARILANSGILGPKKKCELK